MDLRPAVERAVRTLRADDPLRPVVVVVPNRLLGVWLSRSIFADTGHMAIDFLLAHELAWRVAAPSLLADGRARLPEHVGLALLLAATDAAVSHEDTPAYLRDAARTAGFAPAALRTIADLAAAQVRPESLDTLASAAADPQRLRLVARLMRGFESGLATCRAARRRRRVRGRLARPAVAVGGRRGGLRPGRRIARRHRIPRGARPAPRDRDHRRASLADRHASPRGATAASAASPRDDAGGEPRGERRGDVAPATAIAPVRAGADPAPRAGAGHRAAAAAVASLRAGIDRAERAGRSRRTRRLRPGPLRRG